MTSAELDALLDLLTRLVLSPRTGVLIGLLVIAAVGDVRTGRIRNWLVFGGAAYAIAYNAFFPVFPRDIGILFALGGLAIGLAALLPLYALRVMGAGDVKLMAMVGAFLGPAATVGAVLATLIAGGILAIGYALWSRTIVRMVRNVALMCKGTMLTFAAGVGGVVTTVTDGRSAGRMPYGVAIALGTSTYLVLTQLGFI